VPCGGSLEVILLKEPNVVVARQEVEVHLAARGRLRQSVDQILGRFYDCNYVYRFGPPHHDVVIATWYDEQRQVVSDAFHFIHRREPSQAQHVALDATVDRLDERSVQVTLRCDAFLHGARLEAEGWLPDDNYFHLPPERASCVTFRPLSDAPKVFRCTVDALNYETGASLSERAR
jgi:beta-mannosidase